MNSCICVKCYVDRFLTKSKAFEKENIGSIKSMMQIIPFLSFIKLAIDFAKNLVEKDYYAATYARLGLQSTWVIENNETAYLWTQNVSGTYEYFKLNLKEDSHKSVDFRKMPLNVQLYFNNIKKSNLPTYGKEVSSNSLCFQWTPYEQQILKIKDKYAGVYFATTRLFPCDTILTILHLYSNFTK